jgi:primosomal protein N' (replication factor Y)
MGEDRLVAVAVPAPLLEPLTYRVPAALAGQVVPGGRVRVPLGRRRVVGVVLSEAPEVPEGVALRDVLEALDPPDRPALPPDLLETVHWTIDYYLAPPGDVIRAVLPAALSPEREGWVVITGAGREAARFAAAPEALGWLAKRPAGRARPRAVLARLEDDAQLDELVEAGLLRLQEPGASARGAPVLRRVVEPSAAVRAGVEAALADLARAPARQAALREALAGPARPVRELAAAAGVSDGAVTALIRAGALVERLVESEVHPVLAAEIPVERPRLLSDAQREAVGRLEALLDARAFAQALLFGVTGSGKTEVYLRAAEHALAQGRGVLFLVPEIALTAQAARALEARFGEQVVILHSGMNDRQRHDAWRRTRDGVARVVVGARSALFAPIASPGLIVVDEEHDGGFKQDESPRYHARDLALVRGRAAGAVVVQGSATPSLECWARAAGGQAELLRLPGRVAGGELARVELVDMREEFRETGGDRLVSRRLAAALEGAIARGEQAMVLLNRRGFASSLLCRSCGEAAGCPSCSIPLTWHKVGQRLRCHYCGHQRRRPEACPACGSEHLAEIGTGTQRAEEILRETVPDARLARLDRDTARSPRRLAAVLERFARGEIDVLVGTQMIAKGHHFPRVTVVGVLSADTALYLPDFRAAERTYALLTQVAGRAGRSGLGGTVVVQAYRADHPALEAVIAQDYEAFAAREWPARQALRYPPAAALANVLVRDEEQQQAYERAAALAARIREFGEGHVAVLGPTPAPIARLRDEWRIQLLVRARRRRRLQDALGRALRETTGGERPIPRWLSLDIDPLQLL